MRNLKVIAIMLVVLVASGCAGQMHKLPMYKLDTDTNTPRATFLSMTTAGDTLDRSSSLTQVGYDSGKTDADGNPIIIEIASELQTGNTVVGQGVLAVVNGTGAAYLQKRAIENSARTHAGASVAAASIYADGNKCPEGVEICNSSIIQVAGASAASVSESNSNANANIESNSSSCPSGQCSAMPMFNENNGGG